MLPCRGPLVLLTLAALVPLLPAEEPAKTTNAALVYWQAFALMPDLDAAKEKILTEWDKTPLDQATVQLVKGGENSLRLLRRAAALPACDWGLDRTEGPMLLIPHLTKARMLGWLACLRARWEFTEGKPAEAVADALAAMGLARHCASDPILINQLVGNAVENNAIDVIQRNFAKLDAPTRKHLAERLPALPKATTIRQAMETEKVYMRGWMLDRLKRNPEWKKDLEMLVGNEGVPADLGNVTKEQATKYLEDLQPVYDTLAESSEAGPDKAAAKSREILTQARDTNPMARLLLPALEKVLAANYRTQARLLLLRAGLAVADGGLDRVKDFKDPFGDGPVIYKPFSNGFTLESKLVHQGQPVVMHFGTAPKQ